MRKTKEAKKKAEDFKVNIVTLKRMISLLVENTSRAIILMKINKCKDYMNTFEDFHYLVEYLSKDILNHEEIKDELDKIYSIDDSGLIYDNESANNFSGMLFRLVDEAYIEKAFKGYSPKQHKINQMLERSKIMYNEATGEKADVFQGS